MIWHLLGVALTGMILGACTGSYLMASVMALLLLRRLPRTIPLDHVLPDHEAVLDPAFIWRVRVYAGLGIAWGVGLLGWQLGRIVWLLVSGFIHP